MKKKQIPLSNIQENHTLGEYQRYFSHLLIKGKLHRYKISEKIKLNPKRQYWKITDDKGDTYFYELPKYIKPSYGKSAYSMKRVMHRRPARAALAIFVGTAAICLTSSFVAKRFLNQNVKPQPYNPEVLGNKLEEFINWRKAHSGPDADVTKDPEFTISDLPMISMANALFVQKDSSSNEMEFERRPLLAVGSGYTVSIGIIEVNISNAFIYDKDNKDALEESISNSDSSSSLVPHVGRRDFYISNKSNDGGEVISYPGVATGKTTVNWSDKSDKQFTEEDYIEKVGKIPDNPFLYSIDEETVKSGSSAEKVGNEYHIHINLDTVKGVARYKKRMIYLSGKTPTRFIKVNLDFVTDLDLHPITLSVDESYEVDYMFSTDGKLTTRFYYDDVPEIPNPTVPFDYSKYPV